MRSHLSAAQQAMENTLMRLVRAITSRTISKELSRDLPPPL